VATDFRITDMHIVYWDGLKPTPTDKNKQLGCGPEGPHYPNVAD
jgi:hypothetical protein